MVNKFIAVNVASSSVPPIDPTKILLVNQQNEARRNPTLIAIPFNIKTVNVPIVAPITDHICHHDSVRYRPSDNVTMMKKMAIYLELV